MELVKPVVEILEPQMVIDEMLRRVEYAGRTCYKSEDRITDDSSAKFVKMLIKRGHHSVLEHEKLSVKIVCDRGVTHEIVRHRIASYSQESTRYCNYNKLGIKFIIPCDWNLEDDDLELLRLIEEHYNKCLTLKKRTPQQARYFLPNGLKTEIVMTCNLREWRHFFNLRADSAAHPQTQEVAKLLLKEFYVKLPAVFEDLYITKIGEL